MNISVVSQGFGVGISLIAAIGAQNTYVLKKGILKKNIFIISLVCSLIDLTLISIGTLGLGKIISGNKVLILSSTILGILFLSYYGFKSIINGFRNNSSLVLNDERDKDSLKKSVITVLALSLLNPHVYLDTVILIGSIGAKFEGREKIDFILGASSASFVWFFSLGYGARILTPLFKKKMTWKILDVIIGFIMFSIVLKLVLFIFSNNLI